MVDGKSKVLFWVMAVLIVLSVSATFYRSVILEDFEVIEGEPEESDEEEGTLDDSESDIVDEEVGETNDTKAQSEEEESVLDDTLGTDTENTDGDINENTDISEEGLIENI